MRHLYVPEVGAHIVCKTAHLQRDALAPHVRSGMRVPRLLRHTPRRYLLLLYEFAARVLLFCRSFAVSRFEQFQAEQADKCQPGSAVPGGSCKGL